MKGSDLMFYAYKLDPVDTLEVKYSLDWLIPGTTIWADEMWIGLYPEPLFLAIL